MAEHIADGSRLRPRRSAPHIVEHGRVIVRRRKFGPVRTALGRLFGVQPFLETRLDALGSEVWRLLDGRTLDEVLRALQAAHPEESELAQRLGRCISTWASLRLIEL